MGNIILFESKRIRRVWSKDKQKWFFSIDDVVEVLTDSLNVKDYIKKLRKRDPELHSYWGTNCPLVEMIATDGKRRKIRSADAEGLFRIIQSIPSSKAEPFKRWLAKVGYERVQEIEDPELAMKRTRALYKLKGYSDAWIEKRVRGIAIREELTQEWKERGAREEKDYEILTAEISKASFGVTPSEYKKLKGLKRENLRDHMDDLELIFTMLGERSTTEIHRSENSSGLPKLRSDAKAGGQIAGDARKALEKRLKRPVVSNENYLLRSEAQKKIDR